MKIKKIRKNSTPTTVYDFTVKDVHHYLLENGVVTHNSYIPTKALSGGSGLIYVSDSIAMLSKAKDRDKDKNIVGSIVTVKMSKSRLSRENSEVEVRISYSGGLDRYYGLLDMATDAGLVQCSNGRYTFPEQTKAVTANKIAESPESYFTQEFLKKLDDQYVRPNYTYGSAIAATPLTDDNEDDED